LARLLEFDGKPDGSAALLLDNGEWLRDLGAMEFLRDVGKHFTVNQMVAKESVRARLERPDTGISFTEFSYMLLQAYDFLRLFDDHGCRLQLGASDQWGNITMGVDLIRRVRRQEAYGLTTPLVLKADGTKFGKTESGTVWLDPRRTTPYALYQFLFRSEDSVAGAYLRYFTFLDHDTISSLDDATASRPQERAAQRALARAVCTLVHGEAETVQAEAAAAAVYSGSLASLDASLLQAVRDETPSSVHGRSALDGDGLALVDTLVEVDLAPTKSRARTLVTQGGVSVNDVAQRDVAARITREQLLHDRYVVLRRGREYHLLCFE
jgi:tyrosyl-tRNA synthetase